MVDIGALIRFCCPFGILPDGMGFEFRGIELDTTMVLAEPEYICEEFDKDCDCDMTIWDPLERDALFI